ncbi:MAG TPA: hypothetical protein EYP08_01755 [Pyrodictiaceae archaeon]|nr:hypothetical protein [Pyrodictiaceae archaeon]
MAHEKGQGSSRNGRDSISKRQITTLQSRNLQDYW